MHLRSTVCYGVDHPTSLLCPQISYTNRHAVSYMTASHPVDYISLGTSERNCSQASATEARVSTYHEQLQYLLESSILPYHYLLAKMSILPHQYLSAKMRKRSLESMSGHSFTIHTSKHPRPARRAPQKEFWVAAMRKVPTYCGNPWDFYEPFITLKPHLSLVVCNDGLEVRTMRTFGAAACERNADFPLLEIQHPNFIDVYETYLFKNDVAVIVEYVGFSIDDLLQRSIYPTECEIAYIMSQARLSSSYPKKSSILTL